VMRHEQVRDSILASLLSWLPRRANFVHVAHRIHNGSDASASLRLTGGASQSTLQDRVSASACPERGDAFPDQPLRGRRLASSAVLA
jgi:hypothetical protein